MVAPLRANAGPGVDRALGLPPNNTGPLWRCSGNAPQQDQVDVWQTYQYGAWSRRTHQKGRQRQSESEIVSKHDLARDDGWPAEYFHIKFRSGHRRRHWQSSSITGTCHFREIIMNYYSFLYCNKNCWRNWCVTLVDMWVIGHYIEATFHCLFV